MDLLPGVEALTVALGDVRPAEAVWVDKEATLIVSPEVPFDEIGRVFQEALESLRSEAERAA